MNKAMLAICIFMTALAISATVLFGLSDNVSRVAAIMWPIIATAWVWHTYIWYRQAMR